MISYAEIIKNSKLLQINHGILTKELVKKQFIKLSKGYLTEDNKITDPEKVRELRKAYEELDEALNLHAGELFLDDIKLKMKTNREPTEEEELSKSMVGDRVGKYESEIGKSGEEVMFYARPSIIAALVELILFGAIGAIIGYFIYGLLKDKLHLSTYYYGTYMKIGSGIPFVLIMIFAFKSFYMKIATKFEVSRRFIRSSFFKGFTTEESCDMVKVDDTVMYNFGPISNLKIITKDKTTPIIYMNYIPTGLAKEMRGFIDAHSQNGLTELYSSSRRKGRLDPKVLKEEKRARTKRPAREESDARDDPYSGRDESDEDDY